MSKRVVRYAGLLVCLLLASGCATVKPPPIAKSDVPTDWEGPVEVDAQVWPDTDWWTDFDSTELTGLIQQVEKNNLDLANNRRNLEAAQIALRDAGFSLWPTPVLSLGTGSSYTRTDTGGQTTSGTTDRPYSLDLSITYGGILSKPATYDQAQASYDSSVAQSAALALNTLGTAASTYFQLLLIRDQIVAANKNLENAEAIGRIANARVKAGVAVPIEALQQQIAIERQRTSLRNLQQQALQARASLALLLGRRVEGFDVKGQSLDSVAIPSVQPGLPSELLVRRPDLVQAEAALRNAAANVNVVRTRFFPQISLTSSNSATSDALTDILASPDTVLNIGAALVQTLLDNGQRHRNLERARLSLESALSNYRQAIISAFNGVEVQLNNIQLLEQQAAVAQRNLDAAEEAFRIAQVRYQQGVTDYQTVLTTQNTLFSTRISLLQTKLQRLNAMVALYQALGGGWEVPAQSQTT